MGFEFLCTSCNKVHHGMPSFGADAPLSYFDVPEEDQALRCSLGTDECVIDEKFYFVRGCIELPVHGESEPFVWGVWVSLSESSFMQWLKCFEMADRSHVGPFFGWLNASLKPYPNTNNLRTRVHLRNDGIRPRIELEPTDHPLAVEQNEGISVHRVAELYSMMVHDADS